MRAGRRGAAAGEEDSQQDSASSLKARNVVARADGLPSIERRVAVSPSAMKRHVFRLIGLKAFQE